jgi:hypothetical protein
MIRRPCEVREYPSRDKRESDDDTVFAFFAFSREFLKKMMMMM